MNVLSSLLLYIGGLSVISLLVDGTRYDTQFNETQKQATAPAMTVPYSLQAAVLKTLHFAQILFLRWRGSIWYHIYRLKS